VYTITDGLQFLKAWFAHKGRIRPLGDVMEERRVRLRCAKEVVMKCSYLNEDDSYPVTIRDFSNRGIYFESGRELKNDAVIVLKAINADDRRFLEHVPESSFRGAVTGSDPEACMAFRTHTVAKVKRCAKIDDDTTRYGIGAEILLLEY
jgi:hypothetical protein